MKIARALLIVAATAGLLAYAAASHALSFGFSNRSIRGTYAGVLSGVVIGRRNSVARGRQWDFYRRRQRRHPRPRIVRLQWQSLQLDGVRHPQGKLRR